MYFQIDTINILIFFVMLVNSTYGIIVYFKDRKNVVNLAFFILTITISLWCLTMFGYRGFLYHDSILWASRFLYFTATMIPTAFIYFVIAFSKSEIKLTQHQKLLIPIPMLFLCVMSLIPNIFIFDVIPNQNKETFIIFNQWGHIFFGLYVICYFSWAYVVVLNKYHTATGIFRKQLGYIFIGTLSSTIITLTTNLALLYFGYFNLNWAGQVGIIVMITFIFYSITHHKLFNIKLITAQFSTFLLCAFILIRIFLATNPREILLEVALLIITMFFGILLIRSALHEINQREKIEQLAIQLSSLNSHLSEKVAEQTHEIKKAYELEKKARRDLEKLNETKDQFIMITQHNLRTPVTSIRWELESILSGNHGDISKKLRDTLEDTNTSVHSLIRMVDDFLNIATLKVGSQILTLSSTRLDHLLASVLQELRIEIKEKDLTVSYPEDTAQWPELKADANKIREVLLIIIENAVRYNIDHGTILIENQIKNNTFEMNIKNTGIGITKEEGSNLFNKLFYRSKHAQSKNPMGMGIGLSVAKAIMKAHHGNISITSDGENTGAKVIFTLPINFIENLEKDLI